MINEIQSPKYAINLIPDYKFYEIISNFFIDNKLLKKNFEINIKEDLYVSIKAPFYIDNLENEKNLILSFSNLKNEIEIPTDLNFKEFAYNLKNYNNSFIIELKKNIQFDFFSNQVIRRFDEFRKVLIPSDYQKDIMRFGNLTESQIINYQIWGYPYLFADSTYEFSILKTKDIAINRQIPLPKNLKKLFQNHITINLSKISLVKQSREDGIFSEIASLQLL